MGQGGLWIVEGSNNFAQAWAMSIVFGEIWRGGAAFGAEVVVRRGVVLGGGVAGLLAAWVLGEYAEEVVVVERDLSDVDGSAHFLRRRTLGLPNVRLVHGRVAGLTFVGDRVTGAVCLPDGRQDPVVIPGDLVVDALGRGSRVSEPMSRGGR
jgi:hypothetical protein